MSRMLGYAARAPITTAEALGAGLLAEFSSLARLHSDGWGTAWVDPRTGAIAGVTGADSAVGGAEWVAALAEPASARMIYLRFASRGAPPAPENSQPFRRDGVAFQHNGLVTPRTALVDLLEPAERARLRGSTDSEAYFALVRQTARESGRNPRAASPEAIARGVARVRTRFPDACLNAMLLTGSGLCVVHAAGTRRAPLAAFAERGVALDALPPGHDDDYNALRTTTRGAARIVATTGIDQRGWERLADDHVIEVTPDRVTGVDVPARGALRPD